MRLTTAVTALLLAAGASQLAAQEKGDIDEGRKIAQLHCTRCHVVGDFNPGGGISSTPSFQLLVKRRPDYKERFETFFARRPHPAFLSIMRPIFQIPVASRTVLYSRIPIRQFP